MMNKPHITIRHLFGNTYYICRDDKAEAEGETPQEAYKKWKMCCRIREWKAPYDYQKRGVWIQNMLAAE